MAFCISALIHCPSPTQIYFLFPVSHGNVWLLSEKKNISLHTHTYIASESHFLLFIQACQCQIMTWNCLNIKQWYVLGEYDVDDDKQREIWNVEAGGRWYLSTAQRRSSIGPSQYRTSFCLTVVDLLYLSNCSCVLRFTVTLQMQKCNSIKSIWARPESKHSLFRVCYLTINRNWRERKAYHRRKVHTSSSTPPQRAL